MKLDESKFQPDTRKEIYQFITKYPGLHFSKISRELSIPKTTLKYHINYLKKRELIIDITEDRYVRFYASNKLGVEDKKILNIIQKKTPRSIILYLLTNKAASQKELSKKLKKAESTLSEHIKKLLKLGIIEVAKKKGKNIIATNYVQEKNIKKKIVGREKFYVLKDPYYIYTFIRDNEGKLLDELEVNYYLKLFSSSNNFNKDVD
jgi:predicted transcriptional regulator